MLLVPAVCALAPVANAQSLIDTVERRYNRAQTLEVLFHESYKGPGRPRRTEAGKLMLRKPGRMRWDYTSPEGKLFISDGKNLWLYTPANNRVEKMKLKESDDMRAPLAFLLGRLDFSKEFSRIVSRPEGNDTRLIAQPSNPNLPYTSVEFLVTAEGRIRYLKVTGYDKSLLEFEFDQEKINPKLSAGLFEFKPPPGVPVVVEPEQ